MLEKLFKVEKYIPYNCYLTIFDIPFDKLYDEGKRKKDCKSPSFDSFQNLFFLQSLNILF